MLSKIQNFQIPLSNSGISLSDVHVRQFQRYIDLILDWNKRINLISRKDESTIVENHILESLAFLLSFEISPGSKIVDIGSGAGFPSLPISLIRGDANFLLVESKRLKALFLKEVVSQLKLKNVVVLHGRVESISAQQVDEFDFALSRAVASLEVVYGWVEKILRPNGYYIAWKGGEVEKEVEKLEKKRKNIYIDIFRMDERLVPAEKNRMFVRIKRMESNKRGEL